MAISKKLEISRLILAQRSSLWTFYLFKCATSFYNARLFISSFRNSLTITVTLPQIPIYASLVKSTSGRLFVPYTMRGTPL